MFVLPHLKNYKNRVLIWGNFLLLRLALTTTPLVFSSRYKAVVARHRQLGESGLADLITWRGYSVGNSASYGLGLLLDVRFQHPEERICGLTRAPFYRGLPPPFIKMTSRADRQGMCYTQNKKVRVPVHFC